jgi:hypothetical protein
MSKATAVTHGKHANGTSVSNGIRHNSLTETIPIEQATGGDHAIGDSASNGTGHASLSETLTIVQVSPPEGPETSALRGGSPILESDSAPGAEAVPGSKSEGEAEQMSNSRAPTPIDESLARVRGHLPARRSDWPVEAQRSSERLKFNQARVVELLVSGMTITAAAAQIGVDPSTIHRWSKAPIFVAELEARRSELADSMLDLHMLGNRIGLSKLLELVESTNDSLALRAAGLLVNTGQRAYQFIDQRERAERLQDHLGIIHGFKV